MDIMYKMQRINASSDTEKLDNSNYRLSQSLYFDFTASTKDDNADGMAITPRPSEESKHRKGTEEPSSNLHHSVTNFLNADGLNNVFAGATEVRYTSVPTTTPFRSSSCSPASDSGRSSLPDLSPSPFMLPMFDPRNLSPSSVSPVSNILPLSPALPGSRHLVKPLSSPTVSPSFPLPSTMSSPSPTTASIKSSTSSVVSSTTPEDSVSTASPPPSNDKVAKYVNTDGRNQKSKRTNFSTSQVSQLHRLFEEEQYPDHEMMENIAKDLKMTDKQVKIWFQNKRARHRRRVASSQNNPQGHVIQTTPMHLPVTSIDQSKPDFMAMMSMSSIPSGVHIPFPGISDKMRPQQGQRGSYVARVGVSNECQRFAQPWNNPFWPVPMSNMRDEQYTIPRQHYGNETNIPFVSRQTSWCVSPSYLRQCY